MSAIRGIRGAITVSGNTEAQIVSATRSLLASMISANGIKVSDIASVIFSVTSDLNAQFPAVAARKMGWTFTPLMCAKEMEVPGTIKKCIRVLMHVNTSRQQKVMKHIYMGEARKLRPDLK